jgi:branched-chain amino acid aminotransferase
MCWVNGFRVDPDVAALPVRDRGLTLADGCFETMRAYRGRIFRIDAHLERLAETAARLAIPRAAHIDESLVQCVRALRESCADAAVRLTLTRGSGSGLAPRTDPPSPATVILLVDPLPAPPGHLTTTGLRVCMAEGRRNEHAPTAGLKTLAYTDAVVALMAARARGADDALFLDTAGHLSEATASNLFLVIRGVVHTPPPGCGILAGITRAAVIEILSVLDIPVEEAPIPPSALDSADEVFLTSSLREIAPVTAVDGRVIGTGQPGTLTREVRERYSRLTSDE